MSYNMIILYHKQLILTVRYYILLRFRYCFLDIGAFWIAELYFSQPQPSGLKSGRDYLLVLSRQPIERLGLIDEAQGLRLLTDVYLGTPLCFWDDCVFTPQILRSR
jgi:hypothetical protein